jgi:hypothetical protein
MSPATRARKEGAPEAPRGTREHGALCRRGRAGSPASHRQRASRQLAGVEGRDVGRNEGAEGRRGGRHAAGGAGEHEVRVDRGGAGPTSCDRQRAGRDRSRIDLDRGFVDARNTPLVVYLDDVTSAGIGGAVHARRHSRLDNQRRVRVRAGQVAAGRRADALRELLPRSRRGRDAGRSGGRCDVRASVRVAHGVVGSVGGRAVVDASPRHPHRTLRTSRARRSSCASRPCRAGRASCARGAGRAGGTSCARVTLLRDEVPVRVRGRAVRVRHDRDVRASVVADAIPHRVGGGRVPRTPPRHADRATAERAVLDLPGADPVAVEGIDDAPGEQVHDLGVRRAAPEL